MKKVLLTTCNAKYIHKNLALRWLYTSCPDTSHVIVKEYIIKDQVERMVADICSMKVEVVCFSCYIWNIDKIKEIVKCLKSEIPSLHIIVGGPEVSFDSFDLLTQGVDAISIGEGEQSIWEYIEMLEHTTPYEVVGMCTTAFPNKTFRKTPIAYLETLQNPYFLDMDQNDMGKRYLYLETSRGCPYGCTYCLSSTDRQVRMFSNAYVLAILKQIEQSDVKQVKLLDRTFNADPQRALLLARYMNEFCKNQIFQFEIVAETLSEALLNFFVQEADKQRFRFEIGIQSFHSETLQAVGRLQDNKRLKEVIGKLRDANCTMHVDLIAGLPYEDIHCFQSSFDEVFELHASEVQLGILKLLKGTKLRSQQAQYEFTFHVQAPYDILSTKWMEEQDLRRIHQCADAVEKFWNSGTCKQIIEEILEKQWYTSAFALFMRLGEEYAKLSRPYQPFELFECFYPVLNHIDRFMVDALLLMQYYPRFKQKPKRFLPEHITLEEKKALMWFACEQGIADQNMIFCYGIVDIGFYKECGYQLVLYNKEQQLPKQWFIDRKKTYIKEMSS